MVLSIAPGPVQAAPVDLTVGTVFARTPLWGNVPTRIGWTPDGKRFTYVFQSQDPMQPLPVYIYDVASHRSKLLLASNKRASLAGWSPDGRRVFVSQRGALFVLTPGTGALKRLAATCGSTPTRAAFIRSRA